MSIQSSHIAGGGNHRAEDDFYATDPEAVKMLLSSADFKDRYIRHFLEPCVGKGHIADTVANFQNITEDSQITGIDKIDRGWKGTIVSDFLDIKMPVSYYDTIITNPPYDQAEDFIRKSLTLLAPNGKAAFFLKLHFLESECRADLFDYFPPERIYVFRKRMSTWRNGEERNPEGKKWTTTMCHAWFIWEKNEDGLLTQSEPVIRWL